MESLIDPRPVSSAAAVTDTTSKSAASWSAIIAGAFVAASVSLTLFALDSRGLVPGRAAH